MARVRRRRHDPVLCSAPARRGLHQVDPAEDHRRRHRLALPRRGQTRAEGVNRGSHVMALIQTRRTFLSGIAAAGTAGLIRTRWAEAAEGPLETTTFGCRRVASAFPRC